ncbi:MAG: hypothetical protein FP820_00500 [Sulfurimonas sp.]|jgi:hypothetical protein|nr:hypothetical protein [Sulfurimonas sp.]MBU3939700.1 hypothetical protein [bacterium]MBU4024349.1 hypothetical protein [bacterium]MBU4059951.1 hypothetical protein [bacterium]MBU4111301.1 hypothetical protein [bacterium]
MNITQLNILSQLLSSNPNEAKALVKLVSIDVLKSLGDAKYSILLENKTVTAQSDKPLSEGAKYWTQLTQTKDAQPKLSNLVKIPLLFDSLKNSELAYSTKELHTLLTSKKPEAMLKQNLLENLGNAGNKEEFSNASTLLLSLQNNTFTIPLAFYNSFALLQFKKRYNTKTKKSHIDFYAALELLGPVSGVISLDDGQVSVELGVAFLKTKNFLEDNLKNLSYNVHITLIENIEPLYNIKLNSLLDINV